MFEVLKPCRDGIRNSYSFQGAAIASAKDTFKHDGHKLMATINRGSEDAARVAVNAAWGSQPDWGKEEWAKKMIEVLEPYRSGIAHGGARRFGKKPKKPRCRWKGVEVTINHGFEDAARVAVKAVWRSKPGWGHKEWAKKMYEVLKSYRGGIKSTRTSRYFRGAAIGVEPGNRRGTKKDEEPKRKQTKTVKEPSTMKKKENLSRSAPGTLSGSIIRPPCDPSKKDTKENKGGRATKKTKKKKERGTRCALVGTEGR